MWVGIQHRWHLTRGPYGLILITHHLFKGWRLLLQWGLRDSRAMVEYPKLLWDSNGGSWPNHQLDNVGGQNDIRGICPWGSSCVQDPVDLNTDRKNQKVSVCPPPLPWKPKHCCLEPLLTTAEGWGSEFATEILQCCISCLAIKAHSQRNPELALNSKIRSGAEGCLPNHFWFLCRIVAGKGGSWHGHHINIQTQWPPSRASKTFSSAKICAGKGPW